MKINKIVENKEKFMDLLLLGDEQENMIKKYLYRGE
ncbi:MAG: GNAT family N-acetyltransferase, partial [Candidatus Margulisbacteria bacterium]|nr:GNAT family N-acetyltransferase [Candidatus Margulisiibacteriota bacterium]